ncbi:hypothetical protein [Rickettsiella endosymbiont of Xylota segnis]|uniref:hypothetical protein n=1 Tax=Rickettsiella endosymbiont of Xylota segnis TaxID=3066238 RepID=UPI0030D14BB9
MLNSSLISFYFFWFIFMNLRAAKRTREEKNRLVRMSFDVPIDLRNNFKAKLAKEGKSAREAILEFMKEYIKK